MRIRSLRIPALAAAVAGALVNGPVRPAGAIDYRIPEERLEELVRLGRELGTEAVRARYSIPSFPLGEERAGLLLATKSFEIMQCAAESPTAAPAECTGVLSRTTFDVVLTVDRKKPLRPPAQYRVQIYQGGTIILPVEREESEEGIRCVVRAKFREAVLGGEKEGVVQVFRGKSTVHNPDAASFKIGFSDLR